ncbi:MAG: hypothetical protein AD742_01280 [Methylibium sp. NZG]|nr:MAG: hypothetical protein AD742_01280 [Methylibium sp. NZG]
MQCQRTPQSVAVVARGKSITYAELEQRANRIAHALVGRGIGPGMLVGLCVGRHVDMMPSMLGILKSGAAYVPLDPTFPRDRLTEMAQDAGLKCLVTEAAHAELIDMPRELQLRIDDDSALLAAMPDTPPTHAEPLTDSALIYVIYTSGSTGRPKGVMLHHRGVCNLLNSMLREPGLTADDRMLALATLSFDMAVPEVMLPLVIGARTVLMPRESASDARALIRALEDNAITVMQATPTTCYLLLDGGWTPPRGFKLWAGAEPVPPALASRLVATGVDLWNLYGPTETTVWSTAGRLAEVGDRVSIGKPMANTTVWVIDDEGKPCPVGDTGEICIGGTGVAHGYLGRPELTAERFVPDPFEPGGTATMYRTGDLGRWTAAGTLEHQGRKDFQVKIRGYRIELGEIESQLGKFDNVGRCVVVTREDQPGDVRLVAYMVPSDGTSIDVKRLKGFLRTVLPEYMVPPQFVTMAALPLLPNGKINRKDLPAPGNERPELTVPFQASVNAQEAACCEVFASILNIDKVGRLDNFFELGGNSLLAVRALGRLSQVIETTLSATTLFSYPDAASLVRSLTARQPDGDAELAAAEAEAATGRKGHLSNDDPIAIVAMAGRFPGANTVEGFWDNLVAGRDSITQFTLDTLDPSVPASLRNDPSYVKARGVVEGVETFDHAFFGISAREAEIMDPQQRLFLEISWECLERAGYAPDQTPRPVGVFAGVYVPTYLHRNVMSHPEAIERVGEFQVMLGNDKDYVATRVAHKLNLKGPAIAIHTACSTSLVAVAQAVDSLRLGRCDMALAGAASVTSPPRSGYIYQEGAMLSVDGHTRTFDADATGTVFNDGAAVVLLKRLADAQKDGDQIFAVIRGVATNNDGSAKASFTAPSVQGQAAVIAAAHRDAGVEARSITYVEAHGTATPLGDPVEVEGLTLAFRRQTQDSGFCRIGSAKSNVGHLVAAAGAAGLIKAALSLAHEKLPATIHYKRPNPKIDFARTPFVVNDRLTDWPRSEQPRRAGVSSFGVGGTNAHVVIEEAPAVERSHVAGGTHVLRLSARTPTALDAMAQRLADHLDAHPDTSLSDAAFTLDQGRSRFQHRLCVVADGTSQAAEALRTADHPQAVRRTVGSSVASLVWLFPGQGAQYAGMGRALYQADAAFRSAFGEGAEALRPHLGIDIQACMFDGGADALLDTATTQPATFLLEYALAQAWLARGVRPALLIGHSVGEFAAAVVAGVMQLADAARLVAKRGALMQALPAGSMLSVRLAADKLAALMPAELSLAAENSPNACVVAGPTPAIEAWAAALEAQGIASRLLQTSHAFHSSMMEPAIEPFEAEVRSVRLDAPQIAIISTLTGKPLTAEQATSPAYWARHLREPVRFSSALRTAMEREKIFCLEIGPRGSLSTLARQHQDGDKQAVLAVPTLADTPESEATQFGVAQAQLWATGTAESPSVRSGGNRRRILLPTYPFERKRVWLDVAMPASQPAPPASSATAASATPPVPAAAAPVANAVPAVAISSAAASLAAAPVQPTLNTTMPATMPSLSSSSASGARQPKLVARLRELFEDVAGIDMSGGDASTSFVELGLDSLTLTQAAQQVKKAFSVSVTFRQLMEKQRSFDALAEFLDQTLPPDPAAATVAPAAAAVAAHAMPAAAQAAAPLVAPAVMPPLQAPLGIAAGVAPRDASFTQQLIAQQMQLMSQQLALLSGTGAPLASAHVAPAAVVPAVVPVAAPVAASTPALAQPPVDAPKAATVEDAAPQRYDVKKAFGAIARIHTQASELTPRQRARLDAFVKRYTERTRKSKAYTVEHRPHMADPRVVNGFRPMTKEIVYQIVVERSKGSRMWDLDGNEYIDTLNGFGMNLLGWQPDFINDAVRKQLDLGYEIGPQHPLAGEVSKLLCELTGHDRAGLCNTGSEAVMAALRIARTVTGRNTVVLFTGSYHGTFDEVLVRAGRGGKGISAAPGVMGGMFGDVRVLDYGTPEALEFIRQNADDLAAVVVEPVQSRRPDFQPREFLREVRAITERSGTCFIFDEVITGFRSHLGGTQALFGVRADLACYGKVIGGGFPVGAVCGKREYMDALDGGGWNYGDDSIPSVGVTYFAGTFVRHPLALAAAKASLEYFKRQGPELQAQLNISTAALADELSAFCREVGAPIVVRYFASLWRVTWLEDHPLQDLLFAMMRSRGVHLLDNFPCFMTTAHTPDDIARIKTAFKESVAELQEAEFLPRRVDSTPPPDASRPPVPGAKLGRDKDGRPAWFVPDANAPGKYTKVNA